MKYCQFLGSIYVEVAVYILMIRLWGNNMQLVKEFTVKDDKFQVLAEGYSNSRSWGHVAILMKNGVEIGREKYRYYNRTWEAYTYQSVCKGVLDNYIEALFIDAINTYKGDRGIKRMVKVKRDIVEHAFKIDNAELYTAYNSL